MSSERMTNLELADAVLDLVEKFLASEDAWDGEDDSHYVDWTKVPEDTRDKLDENDRDNIYEAITAAIPPINAVEPEARVRLEALFADLRARGAL